jgi:hypothetical protein
VIGFRIPPAYSQNLNQHLTQSLLSLNPEILKFIDNQTTQLQNEFDARIRKDISSVTTKLTDKINMECNQEFIWKEHSIQHFNTIKHIFDETRISIETLVKYALLIISAVLAIFAVLIGKEYKDFKQIQESFRKSNEDVKNKIDELNNQAQELEALKKQAQEFQEDLEDELRKTIKLKDDLQNKDKEIYEFLEIQKSIKNTRIVWAFESEDVDDDEMVKELQNNGFKNIYEWKIYDEAVTPSKDKSDFMIYSYTNSANSSERLERLIAFLNSIERKIPLIIYTYNNGKRPNMPREEINMLDAYKNYSLSTTPGNFKSQFNSLILEKGGNLLVTD